MKNRLKIGLLRVRLLFAGLHLLAVVFLQAGMLLMLSGCVLYPGDVYRLPADFSGEPWEGDIYFLEHGLPKYHDNVYHTLSQTTYAARIAELKQACSGKEAEEQWALIRGFVASIGDAHTSYSSNMTKAFPLNLVVLEDGIFVSASLRDNERWRLVRTAETEGAPAAVELVAINGHPVYPEHAGLIGESDEESILEILRPLLSHENEGYLKSLLSFALLDPVLLYGAGILDVRDACTMTFRYPGGNTEDLETLDFTAKSLSGFKDLDWAVYYDDSYPADKAVLHDYLRYASAFYWGEYYEESRTLYILYNRCANDPDLGFADFIKQLISRVDTSQIEKVLVDFRNNGGGDSRVIKPLKNLLSGELSDALLYAAIDATTFSSGLMNAADLHLKHGGILIGSPSGGRPNHYGEVKRTQLPTGNSISWSTNYFITVPGSTDDALYPEVSRPITFGDFFTLTKPDPVLAYVRAQ